MNSQYALFTKTKIEGFLVLLSRRLVFKSKGADSNRLSISLSVLLSETPNSRGI